MDNIKTYAIGNGEITLTSHDAEELRIMLQKDYLASVIDELIEQRIDCFKFSGKSARKHFVDELVNLNDDCVNYDSSYFEEMLEENIFNRAEDYRILR